MADPLLFSRDFRRHGGFDTHWPVAGVTHTSKVSVSICEVGNFGGVLKPFQGSASMTVDNVVPEDGGIRVRGSIGWGSDIDIRLHFIVFR